MESHPGLRESCWILSVCLIGGEKREHESTRWAVWHVNVGGLESASWMNCKRVSLQASARPVCCVDVDTDDAAQHKHNNVWLAKIAQRETTRHFRYSTYRLAHGVHQQTLDCPLAFANHCQAGREGLLHRLLYTQCTQGCSSPLSCTLGSAMCQQRHVLGTIESRKYRTQRGQHLPVPRFCQNASHPQPVTRCRPRCTKFSGNLRCSKHMLMLTCSKWFDSASCFTLSATVPKSRCCNNLLFQANHPIVSP